MDIYSKAARVIDHFGQVEVTLVKGDFSSINSEAEHFKAKICSPAIKLPSYLQGRGITRREAIKDLYFKILKYMLSINVQSYGFDFNSEEEIEIDMGIGTERLRIRKAKFYIVTFVGLLSILGLGLSGTGISIDKAIDDIFAKLSEKFALNIRDEDFLFGV